MGSKGRSFTVKYGTVVIKRNFVRHVLLVWSILVLKVCPDWSKDEKNNHSGTSACGTPSYSIVDLST